MEEEENFYNLKQENKEYILGLSIFGNSIRIKCKNTADENIRFSRDFTVDDLKRIDNIFNFIQNQYQALIYLDSFLKTQKVGIIEEGGALKINFYISNKGVISKIEIPLVNQGFMASNFNNAYGSSQLGNSQFTRTVNTTNFTMNQNQNIQLGQNSSFLLGNTFNGTIPILETNSGNKNDVMLFTQVNKANTNSFESNGVNQVFLDKRAPLTQQFINDKNTKYNQFIQNIPRKDIPSINRDFVQTKAIANTTNNINNKFFSPPIINPVNNLSKSLQNLQGNQFSTGINKDVISQFNTGPTRINQDISSQFNSFQYSPSLFRDAFQNTTTQFTTGLNIPVSSKRDENQFFQNYNKQAAENTNQFMNNNNQPFKGFNSNNSFISSFNNNSNQFNQNNNYILANTNTNKFFQKTVASTKRDNIKSLNIPNEQINFAQKEQIKNTHTFPKSILEIGDVHKQIDLLDQANKDTRNNNFPIKITETNEISHYQMKKIPNVQNKTQATIQNQINLPMSSEINTVQNAPDKRINILEGEKISLRNQHQLMQDKINILKGEMNTYKNKLELMEKEKAEREINELRAENQAIKRQLSEFKNSRNDSEEIRILRSQLSELEPLRRKVAEMESLKAQLSELNSLRAKVEELSEIKAQLGELNNLKQQLNKMNLLKSQLGEINNLNAQFAELSGVQSQLKELKNLRSQISQMNALKQQLNELNKFKNNAIEGDNLRRKLNELENIKIQYEKEIRNLRDAQNKNKYSEYHKKKKTKMSSKIGMESKQLLFEDIPQPILIKGDIIHSTDELELVTKKINKLNQKLTLNLLYKATADSDKAEAFHSKCDDAKSTLVLVETDKGRRFGGFTTCSWSGDCIEKKDEDAFIFSFDKMMTYDNIPGEEAIGCYPNFGPVFLGCQIRIYDNAFSKGGTTFEKGLNFFTEEDYELTGGEKEFNINEIEVYEVIAE